MITGAYFRAGPDILNEKDIIFLIYGHLILALSQAVDDTPERFKRSQWYNWGCAKSLPLYKALGREPPKMFLKFQLF